MKYIVTEEQLSKNINPYMLFWIKRRYDLVGAALEETFGLMDFEICRTDDYDKFEKKFFGVFMDCLHPYFYEDEAFSFGLYDEMYNILRNLFHDECFEYYSAGRKKC